jgi:hypothetical protein
MQVQDLSAPQDLGANLGKLQGLAVGGAFITGAMAGGILTQKQVSRRRLLTTKIEQT